MNMEVERQREVTKRERCRVRGGRETLEYM